ncbi:MAG: protein kinase [Verrucomicrobiaceae bacterium]|nr:protein kinase [Verrucomicrobiaceae bacterium]
MKPAMAGGLSFTLETEPAGRVGDYLLGEKLGSGGFADVYAARRVAPAADEKPLALKLLRPGMDSREIVARFELEQRLLRHLNHPGIVNIVDSGLTPQGRPFFVMELIHGLPITEHVTVAAMPVRERMRLFAQVCDAVQHAHQKAVLHRDLKPGNF